MVSVQEAKQAAIAAPEIKELHKALRALSAQGGLPSQRAQQSQQQAQPQHEPVGLPRMQSVAGSVVGHHGQLPPVQLEQCAFVLAYAV